MEKLYNFKVEILGTKLSEYYVERYGHVDQDHYDYILNQYRQLVERTKYLIDLGVFPGELQFEKIDPESVFSHSAENLINIGDLISLVITDTDFNTVIFNYQSGLDDKAFRAKLIPASELNKRRKSKKCEARRWLHPHGDVIITTGKSIPECIERAKSYYGISFITRDQSKDTVGFLTESLDFIPYENQLHPEEGEE